MTNEINQITEIGSPISATTSHKGAMLWNELQQRGSIDIQTKGEALDAITSNWRNRNENELRNRTVVIEYGLMARPA